MFGAPFDFDINYRVWIFISKFIANNGIVVNRLLHLNLCGVTWATLSHAITAQGEAPSLRSHD